MASVARTASASPEDIFSYGPRSTGMGGTGVAHSRDFEATYTNPALLSRLRSRTFTLGYEAAAFDLRATKVDGSRETLVPYEPLKSSVIGLGLPIPFTGLLRNRVGFGMAFSTPLDVIVRGRIVYPEKAQFPLLPDRAQTLAIRLGLGVDVGHGFRVGAGFAALAEIVGSVVVATDASGKVGSRVEDQLVATYAPTVGLSYERPVLTDSVLRVGAVFRGALDARFAIAIDATKLSTLPIPVLNISGSAQYDPMQLAVEAAIESPHSVIAIGATYKRWSGYGGLLESTIVCPPDECNALRPPSIAFKDIVVPRIGGELKFAPHRRVRTALRGGLAYEMSPLPASLPASDAFSRATAGLVKVRTAYFDSDRLLFTVGGGVELKRPWFPLKLDAFAQLHYLLPQTIDLGVGAPGRASGTVLAAGVMAGVSF
jgi:long-chain fatty acid transport protein